MCLGIPGRVIEIYDSGLHVAKVEVNGIRRNVSVDLVHHPDDPLKVGDWVLIHVGFAMSKIDEVEAIEMLELLKQMNEEFEQELEGFEKMKTE